MRKRDDQPRVFTSRARFRAWLERNHARVPELNLRLFKVHAGERGVTYREARDEALCFGWIDGVRRSHDADSFTQRFTPRRRGSKWSQVNHRRMRELQAAGMLAAPGLAAWKTAPKKPAPWYRRTSSFWVMSAQQEETRQRRLDQLIACSAQGKPIAPLARKNSK